MAIDKDIINDIRSEIAEVVTEESETSEIFAAVYAYPESKMEGYPALIVMPSENISDYGSTQANKISFAFSLMVYYQMEKNADYAQAEQAVGEAVGELLRIFSSRKPLTTCDWVEPVPGVWGDTTVGEGVYRTATVTLRCIKYVDVRN